jgi:CubicO group peptidase (beta-lactamase class C family)
VMEPLAWMGRARTSPWRHAMVRRGTILIALALVATALDEHAGGPGRGAHLPAPLRDAHLLALQEALPEAPADALPGTGRAVASDADEPEPPRTIDELRERIERVLTEHDVPGVGIALVERDGSTWTGGVGVASRETGVAVDGDTVFRVGSITKSVVALAILKLVEEHMLELETPVREIAPEIDMINAWEDTAPITVAHLLEHTAGFDDMRFNEMYVPGEDGDVSVAEALARNPRSRVSRWQPGSYHAYANPGYSVAAYVIEKLTGEPFDRHIERVILQPTGMRGASFSLTPEVRARLAQGHAGRRNHPVPHRRLYHRAAGELLASPRQLAGLLELLIHRGATRSGELLRADAIVRMEQGDTLSQPLIFYGLGNAGDPSLPVPTRGHDGMIDGFRSSYRYAPSLGVGYALLFNSSNEGALRAYVEIRALVFDYLTRDTKLPAPPEIAVPAHELARHAGYYELASPRNEVIGFLERALNDVEVRLVAGELQMRLGSIQSIPLIPVAPDRFRIAGHGAAAVAFATREDGTRVMYLLDTAFEEGAASWGTLRRRALTLAYSFMRVGAFWNFLWLPGWLYVMARSRQRLPLPPGAAPALASLCFFAMLELVYIGLASGALGRVHAVSLGCFTLGLAFPALSAWGLAQAVIELRRGSTVSEEIDELASLAAFGVSIFDRGLRGRIYDLAVALACMGMSLYLIYHGVIGLRTWAW